MDELFGDDDDVEIGSENDNRGLKLTSRPKECGVLAFHTGTEEALLAHLRNTVVDERDKANCMLKAIDHFCYSRHWMMHVGDVKGKILDDTFCQAQSAAHSIGLPFCAVELGSYCGYSALRLGSKLTAGDFLFCVEGDEKCVQWTRRMLEMANLSSVVKVIPRPASDCIGDLTELMSSSGFSSIGLLFIDHDKAQYYNDLLIFEKSGLLKSGAYVVADNVLSFGQPKQDYLDHVRQKHLYCSSVLIESPLEYTAESVLTTEELLTVDAGEEVEKLQNLCSVTQQLNDGVEISVVA